MSIIHVKSGSREFADKLRNEHIAASVPDKIPNGVLLVHEDQKGELHHQLEKIIYGAPYNSEVPVDKIPWKTDPLIIVVGNKLAVLKEFEKLVPGFTKKFGPIKTVKE